MNLWKFFINTDYEGVDGDDWTKNRCVTLIGCFFTTFDMSFKQTGSTGGYLAPDGDTESYVDKDNIGINY